MTSLLSARQHNATRSAGTSVEMTGGGASQNTIPSQGQTVRPQGRGKVPPPSENPQARAVGSGAEGCTWVVTGRLVSNGGPSLAVMAAVAGMGLY